MIFKINGVAYPMPKKFIMAREDNIVSAITTISGKTIGDVRGWKYSNTTIKFPYLTNAELNNILMATNQEFTISFTDLDGAEKTVNAIRTGITASNVFRYINAKPCYTDIELGVSFPDVYNN